MQSPTLYILAWKNQIREDVCEVNPQFTLSCGGKISMLIIIMSEAEAESRRLNSQLV